VLSHSNQTMKDILRIEQCVFLPASQALLLLLLLSSSSSLHGLGESPVPASSIMSLSIFFLVYLCLVFRMVDIYMPVVECG
jgi:hypothetical protein